MNKHDTDHHEFKPLLTEIQEKPVSPLGRLVYWLIVAIILVALLWLFLGKIDVVITARGKIIPDGHIKILQPLETGVVKKILVKEGDFVKKGQVLMEVDPATTEPALDSLKQNLAHVDLEASRLIATASGTSFTPPSASLSREAILTQHQLYTASLQSLQKQLDAKRLEQEKIHAQKEASYTEKVATTRLLSMAKDQEVRYQQVKDLIAKQELEALEEKITGYETQRTSLQAKLEELTHQEAQVKDDIAHLTAQFKADQLKELSELQKQRTELSANIQEITFRNTKQKIIAPVDGYVNTLFIHTIGGVVSPAEKLMSIVPAKTNLLVQATVLNKDIGFVEKDDHVSIKVDTFDFQKYGLLDGVVKQVSKDSIDHEQLGPVYNVYITPLEKTLMVEGRPIQISTGMSVTAEIKTGKRRIIEFFIYPLIKYWNEGISVR